MANPEHVELLKKGVSEWNDWRKSSNEVPDLAGVNLDRANFNGVNLFKADLSRASLTGADLKGTDLGRADLIGADLNGAKFRGADLSGANLFRANLKGTNLAGVDFWGANLSGADLAGANLQGARLFRTMFGDVDLSEVKGLEEVEHHGPSIIGLDTIYKSGGKIPEVFLRGAGVDESFITYMGSLVGRAIEFYSCFISYSHADKAFARQLHDGLQGRGIRCWLDERQLLPGDDIYSAVDHGIRLWDKVLLCCSKESLKSWWVDNEINKAFTKEQELMKERGKKTLALIPLNLDGALFAWEDGKADEIRRRLAANFTGWDRDMSNFHQEFEKLVQALMTGDRGREVPPKSLL